MKEIMVVIIDIIIILRFITMTMVLQSLRKGILVRMNNNNVELYFDYHLMRTHCPVVVLSFKLAFQRVTPNECRFKQVSKTTVVKPLSDNR